MTSINRYSARLPTIIKWLLLWHCVVSATFAFALPPPHEAGETDSSYNAPTPAPAPLPHTEELMSLPQLPGFKSFTTKNGHDYKGQCGSAKIRVNNVDRLREDIVPAYTMDYFDVTFEIYRPGRPGKVLKLAPTDYSSIACVQTAQGKRILIGGICGGALCSHDFYSYYVIDPEKLTYVAPKDPVKNLCDDKCVTRLVGQRTIEFLMYYWM